MLRYKPGTEAGERQYPFLEPVSSYMRAEGARHLQHHHLQHMEFWN